MESEEREIAGRLEAATALLERTLGWLEERQGVLTGEVERISATVEQSRREAELAEKLVAAETVSYTHLGQAGGHRRRAGTAGDVSLWSGDDGGTPDSGADYLGPGPGGGDSAAGTAGMRHGSKFAMVS